MKKNKLLLRAACAALASVLAFSAFPAAAFAETASDEAARTITLTENKTEQIIINEGENATLDLNGFTLSSPESADFVIDNAGELLIKDSSEGRGLIKQGNNPVNASAVINRGTLKLENAAVETKSSDGIAYGIDNAGTLEMTDSAVSAYTAGSKWAIAVYNSSVIKSMTGCRIKGQIENTGNANNALGVSNEENAVIAELSNNTIEAFTNTSGVAYGIRNKGKINKITSGLTYGYSNGSGWTFALYNTDVGTIDEISGGIFYGDFSNSSSSNNGLGISNEGVISLISGGFFSANITGGGSAYGVRSDNEITLITGGAFSGSSAANALYRRAGTANFAGGHTFSSMSPARVRYVLAGSDKYVELADEHGEFFSAYSYSSDSKIKQKYGYSDSDSYTVLRLPGDNNKSKAPTVLSAEQLSKYADNQTLYVKRETQLRPILYFLGSSVTYGHTTGAVSFVENLERSGDFYSVKRAVSGTTLVLSTNSYISRMKSQIGKNAKIDCFTCQLSTNDATQNKPLGSISSSKNLEDFKATTVIGAIEYIICYAKQTWNCPVVFYTNPKFNSPFYVSMINALYKLQDKWDFDIIDFYNYKDMTPLSSSTLSSYMSDSIHPNAKGYQWMTGVMSARFKEILSRKPQEDPKPSVPVAASGVKLSKSSLKLAVGSKAVLSARVSPGNAADKTVFWKSSNSSVASVKSGTVSAKKPGRATISATTKNGKTAKCTVFVRPGKIKSLTVKKSGKRGAKLRYSKSNGGSKYQIYMKKGKGKFRLIKTTGKRSFVKSALTGKKAYSFKVRAYKIVSGKKYQSDFSKIVKFKLKRR